MNQATLATARLQSGTEPMQSLFTMFGQPEFSILPFATRRNGVITSRRAMYP